MKERTFKIIYPNHEDKDLYIQELVEYYSKMYTEFSDQQIRVPIKIIASLLFNRSKEFAQFNSKVASLWDLRNLANGAEPEIKSEVFWMIKGNEIAIKKFIGIRNKVSMPEKMDLYAEFIKIMSTNTIHAICNATYDKLPSKYKLQYPMWFSEMYENNESNDTEIFSESMLERKVRFTLDTNETAIDIKDNVKNSSNTESTPQSSHDHESSKRTTYSSTENDNLEEDSAEDNNYKSVATTKDYDSKDITKIDDIVLSMLNSFIAWIYDLEEDLQNQLLNSIPIKEMIEESARQSKILSRSIKSFFDYKSDVDFEFKDNNSEAYDEYSPEYTSYKLAARRNVSDPFDKDVTGDYSMELGFSILLADSSINIIDSSTSILGINGIEFNGMVVA